MGGPPAHPCLLPGLPAPPSPTPHLVGRNVREAAQGGLEEPQELQRPLQSPERHDAALGRLGAGEEVLGSVARGLGLPQVQQEGGLLPEGLGDLLGTLS